MTGMQLISTSADVNTGMPKSIFDSRSLRYDISNIRNKVEVLRKIG